LAPGALILIVAGLGVFVAAPLLQGASDGADLSPEGLTLGQRRATRFLILDLESAQSGSDYHFPTKFSRRFPPNSHLLKLVADF